MTRSELALLTEWVFSQGKLGSQDELMKWCVYLCGKLNPSANTKLIIRGSAELLCDLHPVWRKLTYGGRDYRAVSSQRREFLDRWMQTGQFTHLAA